MTYNVFSGTLNPTHFTSYSQLYITKRKIANREYIHDIWATKIIDEISLSLSPLTNHLNDISSNTIHKNSLAAIYPPLAKSYTHLTQFRSCHAQCPAPFQATATMLLPGEVTATAWLLAAYCDVVSARQCSYPVSALSGVHLAGKSAV